MLKSWKVDVDAVDEAYRAAEKLKTPNLKDKTILKGWKQQFYNYDSPHRQTYYPLLFYLTSITYNRLLREFNINNAKDVDTLVKVLIQCEEIDNLKNLMIHANISKHIEHSYSSFRFSDNFKVEHMPDDVIINLLDNIENRLAIF